MKILIIASYNKHRYAPFIVEQAEALQGAGCEIEWFGVQGKGIAGYIREISRLRKIISEFRPDVIHAHYGLSCLLANLATRRVPVVSTYHGSDINMPKVRRFSKMAIRLSAWNIFVSKKNMALAGVVEGKKASLVPCGVSISEDQMQSRNETRKALGWKADEKKVLFAGAFDNAVKDPELAKQAINELKNEGVNAELVELKGYNRDQVNALMYSCDAFLMTSKTEGSPQVIKEAMACGCPIVSVDVGDVKERVEGLEGCYVVESRNPQDLAEALRKALAFEGRTKGRERIVKMGLMNEQVAKRVVEIYNKVREERVRCLMFDV